MRLTRDQLKAAENAMDVNVLWNRMTGEPGNCSVVLTGDKKTDAETIRFCLKGLPVWKKDLEDLMKVEDKAEWKKAAFRYEREYMRDPEYYAAKEEKEKQKAKKQEKPRKPEAKKKPVKSPARKKKQDEKPAKRSTMTARRKK